MKKSELRQIIKEELQKLKEARSINKIQSEWSKVTTDMKSTVEKWKTAEGKEKDKLMGILKDLTAKKKSLEKELEDAISEKDRNIELVVKEQLKLTENKRYGDWSVTRTDGNTIKLVNQTTMDTIYAHIDHGKYEISYKSRRIIQPSLKLAMDKVIALDKK